ncbi:hypothetical protein RGQ29_013932 [Quercus rubra]|uniref:Uncharacterized protein n=1 Tax=Quercus rubra TaxID=3512 RepID=A0AAN7J2K0_QUERU|nr:hypothetical protein RGQ29_013932 [Quercus rubra]
MQWPRSYCNVLNMVDEQCYPPVPHRFTVHGLWPQISRGRNDCRDTRRNGPYHPLNWNQVHLNGREVRLLNYYWRDLRAPEGYSQSFWATEYNKHGSCTFNNPTWYFRLTLILVGNFGIFDLRSRLFHLPIGRRIIPGNIYPSTFIRDAVYSVTHRIPILHCVEIDYVFQLLEIRFCANRDSRQLRNCVFSSNCGNSGVLIPLA